jgi:hypothetical protein
MPGDVPAEWLGGIATSDNWHPPPRGVTCNGTRSDVPSVTDLGL